MHFLPVEKRDIELLSGGHEATQYRAVLKQRGLRAVGFRLLKSES